MQVSENRRTNSGLGTETPEEADWDRSRSLGRTTRRYYRAVGIRTEYRKDPKGQPPQRLVERTSRD